MLDIPADAAAGLGLFENIHGFPSADAFARHLKQASAEFYGTAAPEYLSAIAGRFEATQGAVQGFKADFVSSHCPAGADGQVSRAAERIR